MARIRFRWRVTTTGILRREKRPHNRALPAAPNGRNPELVGFLFRDGKFGYYTLAARKAVRKLPATIVSVTIAHEYVCYYNFPTKEAAAMYCLTVLAEE